MIIGYKNNIPQKISIKRPCQGYYLRWWYSGWHYWAFYPGKLSLITEGEKYRTIGTRSVTMGTGQITYSQCQAIRTIINTREVYLFAAGGWANVRIDPGSFIVYDNQVNGYEIELAVKIGSKEISLTGFSPIAPDVLLYNPNVITIITVIDGVFTIVVSGAAGETIIINWGDGSAPEVIVLTGGDQTITHDYTGSGGAEHVITIDGEENIIILDLSDNDIIAINIPDTAISLTELDLSGNLLTEIPNIPPTVPLIILDMGSNPLTICQVKIGIQVWMCKNYDSDFPGSKVYDNNEANRAIYGGLYTYDQIMAPGFCPAGYHIPTLAEYNLLISYIESISGSGTGGGKLKQIGTTRWDAPNTGAVDVYGFTVLPSGYYSAGLFLQLNQYAWLLTSTIIDATTRYAAHLEYNSDNIAMGVVNRSQYFAVRLIRNWAATPNPPVDDYFLPSKDEMQAIYDELYLYDVGYWDPTIPSYWTSSEIDANNAYVHDFDTAFGISSIKTSNVMVRACRAFTSTINYNLRDIGPAGGYIFWKSGNDYLEAAPYDQSASQIWSNIIDIDLGTTGTAIGTGQANTTAIMNQVESEAAKTIVTVGSGGTYPTLWEVFFDINNGIITGDIVIRVVSNLDEDTQAILQENGFGGTANYNSVIIYPTITGVVITTTILNDSLIVFNGASNVTIDGRVNRVGSTDMVINSGAYKAIEFVGSPTNIVVYDTVIIEGITGDIQSITSSAAKLCNDLVT